MNGIANGESKTGKPVCWDGCAAPLCPLEDNTGRLWYPDEPICHKRGEKPKWIIIQKRIARKARNHDRFFTVKDFEVTRVQNPRGHNPDKETPQDRQIRKKINVSTTGEKRGRVRVGKCMVRNRS